MDPEAAKARFINRIIPSPPKMMLQVMNQLIHFRGLAKYFVLAILRINTYTPALFVHIQTDVNRLTRKINSVNVNHGKPPFGKILLGNKIIAENMRLAFFFNVCSKNDDQSLSRVIHRGPIERRDFSPAPSGGAGRARKGKISELS
jgi:hypothetical protein